MRRFHLSSRTLSDNENHDDFIVVWVDSSAVPKALQNFDTHLENYSSCQTCENHIKRVKSERKFLLIFKDFIPEIDFENLCQIQSIYIWKQYGNIEYDRESHPKIVGTFENIENLINRLRKDIILTYRRDLPINISRLHEIKIEHSLINLHENTSMFLWNQLLIFYLVQFPKTSMDQLKIDMIDQCKLDYKDDEGELDRINDFEKNCTDKNAIEWYTKDSFLYRLLNKAFRTRNTDLMCKFQYFIILLYNNFEYLSKNEDENPLVVYRGQTINKNELEILKSNVGGIISMNTILSTSRKETTARSFILDAENGVIFKINLPNRTYNSFKPFIDISRFSTIQSEEEILFFLGTVFTIDSVKSDNNSTWIIGLTLNNEPSIRLKQITTVFEPSISIAIPNEINRIIKFHVSLIKLNPHLIMKTDDLDMIDLYYFILTKKQFSSNNNSTIKIYIHLAFILSNLGLYKEAIKIYEQGLKDVSIESPEFKVIHIVIGYLYYHASDSDNAFLHYAIVLSVLDENNLLISELYRHIGDVQKKIKNINISLSYYQEALKIANNQHIPSLRCIYDEIVDILNEQDNSDEAFMYKNQSNEIDPEQCYLPQPRCDDQTALNNYLSELENSHNLESIKRADLLYRIGIRLMVLGRFDEALKTFLEANDLYRIQPPSLDRFPRYLSTLYDNIALLYLCSEDYLKALVMWQKGINIRSNFFAKFD